MHQVPQVARRGDHSDSQDSLTEAAKKLQVQKLVCPQARTVPIGRPLVIDVVAEPERAVPSRGPLGNGALSRWSLCSRSWRRRRPRSSTARSCRWKARQRGLRAIDAVALDIDPCAVFSKCPASRVVCALPIVCRRRRLDFVDVLGFEVFPL